MGLAIKCDDDWELDRFVVEAIKTFPRERLLILTDAHLTLTGLAEHPSPHLLALLHHIYDETAGGLIIVTSGTISELDKEFSANRLPVIGGRGDEFRLERDGAIGYMHQRHFESAVAREAQALHERFPHLNVELVPPTEMPGSIYFTIAAEVRDSDQIRGNLLGKVEDFVNNLQVRDDIFVTGGYAKYITFSPPNKERALETFLSNKRFSDRIIVAFGDGGKKEGALLSAAVKSGGYGFLVGPRAVDDELPPEVFTLKSPIDVTNLLSQVFDFPEALPQPTADPIREVIKKPQPLQKGSTTMEII